MSARQGSHLEAAHRRLSLVGSERRAPVLLEEVRFASIEDARTLLAEWFNCCDAMADQADALREQFVRCGFVTDTDEKLVLPAIVYRAGWESDDPAKGLSWTKDLAFAERFCRGLFGPRAWFLGLRRDGERAVVWEAVCTEALGYLTGREESEVIPAKLERIQPLMGFEAVEGGRA